MQHDLIKVFRLLRMLSYNVALKCRYFKYVIKNIFEPPSKSFYIRGRRERANERERFLKNQFQGQREKDF